MRDADNRRIWAADQRKKARASFVATIEPADVERAKRLAALRELADSLSGLSHMTGMLADVNAEISRLEAV